MILITILALIVLAGIGLSLLRLSRPVMKEGTDHRFDSAPFEGLFAEPGAPGEPSPDSGPGRGTEIRAALLERAGQGDLKALTEAHASKDLRLYREVLKALVAYAGACQERLGALVCHVVQNGDLRASPELANLMIENWEKTPGSITAIEMLHVSALSDDSQTFQRAMDSAFSAWGAGRLDLSAEELLRLIANEYWVLSPEARRSGESFLLKRRISQIRRRLARRGSGANEEGENHE